jgi:SWI/SNF-related matrix-associated actin-dependent regulator 1 of chromatin subfamily A
VSRNEANESYGTQVQGFARSVAETCVGFVWHQADVCAACGIAENDPNRILKPYQLVGVNFMLLLHRKHVGGGMRTFCSWLSQEFVSLLFC